MLGCMLARSETDKLLAVYNGERTVIYGFRTYSCFNAATATAWCVPSLYIAVLPLRPPSSLLRRFLPVSVYV